MIVLFLPNIVRVLNKDRGYRKLYAILVGKFEMKTVLQRSVSLWNNLYIGTGIGP
jgi:hypothetical protein